MILEQEEPLQLLRLGQRWKGILDYDYEINEDSHIVSVVRIMYAGRDASAQFDETF